MRVRVHKTGGDSAQYSEESELDWYGGGCMHPFFDPYTMLSTYYLDVYHARCLRIYAALLSDVKETDLDGCMPQGRSVNDFLYALGLDYGIYGNGYYEKAGSASAKAYYWLPGFEGRLTRDFKVVQYTRHGEVVPLDDAGHLSTHSPKSRFYGEPYYLQALQNINTSNRIATTNDAFFENGAVPDFAVIAEGAEIDEGTENKIATSLSQIKGDANSHKSLFLSAPAGMDGKNPSIRLEDLNKIRDMDFKELLHDNRDRIVASSGVPPRIVGILTSAALGGSGELLGQLKAFKVITADPLQESWEKKWESQGHKLLLNRLDVTAFKDDNDVLEWLSEKKVVTDDELRTIFAPLIEGK